MHRLDVELTVAARTSSTTGLGAWAAVLAGSGTEKRVSGFIRLPDGQKMTPNAAAVRAIEIAVERLGRPCRLSIRTQSHYVQSAVPRLRRWSANEWLRKDPNDDEWRPVANAKQWRSLLSTLELGGHLVSRWIPVGGYEAFEQTWKDGMLLTRPLGEVIAPNALDDLVKAQAAKVLAGPLPGPELSPAHHAAACGMR